MGLDIKLGHDLCLISRFESLILKEKFLKRIFGEEELRQARNRGKHVVRYLAGRWTAKESLSKAMGLGLFSWSLSEIQFLDNSEEKGVRFWTFSRAAFSLLRGYSVTTSISYEGDMASAVTVLYKEQ